MNNTHKWFTLIELVVVISIMMILSAVWFINYSWSLLDSRNSARISDMWSIKISLWNHKLKNGTYPTPWNFFSITNSWTVIKQGLLNESVETLEIKQKPRDPLIKWRYYTYSTTSNWLFFQAALSLEETSVSENTDKMRALVDWDYQSSSYNLAPTIVFATNSTGTIQSLSWAFILNKWTYNLPYGLKWDFVNWWRNFSTITTQAWINIPKYCWFYSCTEIYEKWRSVWDWEYCILDENQNQINTQCYMSSIWSQWKDISWTNCSVSDIVIWNQTWAWCNSTLWTSWLIYNTNNNCYNYLWVNVWWTSCYWDTTKEITYNSTYWQDNIWWKLYKRSDLNTNCKAPTNLAYTGSYNLSWSINTNCPCPDWWHIPTDTEFEILETTLNSWTNCRNTTDWRLCDWLGWSWSTLKAINNNIVKALKLPLAGSWSWGSYIYRGFHANLWSSTIVSASTNARGRYLSRNYTWVNRSYWAQSTNGFSIRCIRDNYHN